MAKLPQPKCNLLVTITFWTTTPCLKPDRISTNKLDVTLKVSLNQFWIFGSFSSSRSPTVHLFIFFALPQTRPVNVVLRLVRLSRKKIGRKQASHFLTRAAHVLIKLLFQTECDKDWYANSKKNIYENKKSQNTHKNDYIIIQNTKSQPRFQKYTAITLTHSFHVHAP